MKRISIDIGGTFTDCVLAWRDRRIEAKAPTTHHDYSQGFLEAVELAADDVEESLNTVLSEVDSIRYGTTLGTNALVERTGERVGLIITEGFEDTTIIGRGRSYGDGLPNKDQVDIPNSDRPEPLVPPRNIFGIRERVDYKGDVMLKPRRENIREIVNKLIDRGVRAIAVVLLHAPKNPVHEQLVAEVVQEEYPSHMLGSIPVVMSHQVTGRTGEYTRANASIINAYLHRSMREGLKDLEKTLRARGYDQSLQLVHNTLGMARLGKTFSIQTMHAGPVAGLSAGRQLSNEIEENNFITTDMGGTSLDIGVVVDGGVRSYDYEPVIDRWLINLPMVYMKSIGAGGGSILAYDREADRITVGPESAGSDPGPACYDRGGREPTVTDADVILGYINPENFWGGKLELNRRLAERTLRRKVADPMGVDVLEAAAAVRRVVNTKSAQNIFNEISLQGYDPRRFSILSYGGAGPTHSCEYAQEIGIDRVIIPPLSPVLSAAGGANLDQLHMHERSVFMNLYDGEGEYFDDFDRLNDLLRELILEGRNDLIDEGYDPERIHHTLEADMRYGTQLQTTTATISEFPLQDRQDLMVLLQDFYDSYGQSFGETAHMPESGINLRGVRVKSYVELDKMSFLESSTNGSSSASPEPRETRDCYFEGSMTDTPIYRYNAFTGGTVEGPAVIEHPSTTIVVLPDWDFVKQDNGLSYMENTS